MQINGQLNRVLSDDLVFSLVDVVELRSFVFVVIQEDAIHGLVFNQHFLLVSLSVFLVVHDAALKSRVYDVEGHFGWFQDVFDHIQVGEDNVNRFVLFAYGCLVHQELIYFCNFDSWLNYVLAGEGVKRLFTHCVNISFFLMLKLAVLARALSISEHVFSD